MPDVGWIKINFSKVPEEIIEQLSRKRSRLMEVLYTKVSALTYQLQTKVILKLTNQVLHVRTGVLRGSVNAKTTTDGTIIRGTVESSGGPAHYGVFHEKGVPHSWQIVATKSRALAFQLSVKESAKTIFAKRVTHPPLPERSFMRSTLEENRSEVIQQVAQAVADVFREK